MKIERLPNTARVVQVAHMAIDGNEFVPPSSFEETLEALCEVDGSGGAVVLYNPRLQEVLEKAGLVKTNARGGCYGTAKLRENREKILAAFYKDMPDAKLTDRPRDR